MTMDIKSMKWSEPLDRLLWDEIYYSTKDKERYELIQSTNHSDIALTIDPLIVMVSESNIFTLDDHPKRFFRDQIRLTYKESEDLEIIVRVNKYKKVLEIFTSGGDKTTRDRLIKHLEDLMTIYFSVVKVCPTCHGRFYASKADLLCYECRP